MSPRNPTAVRLMLAGTWLLALAASAGEINFVPNVIGQFDALSVRPDPLGFWKGNSPDPTKCKHYQGMVRYQADDGTPYLLVTRSGNIPDGIADPLPDSLLCWTVSEEPGNLLVVRLGTRDKNGERLRSNRLRRGANFTFSIPEAADTTVAHVTFNGANGWPKYRHPGGMQLVGNVLAIALEAPYEDPTLPQALVLFVDVTDPENPRITSRFPAPPVPGAPAAALHAAGLVGVTPLPDGHYLMVVTGRDNHVLELYRSESTDLASTQLSWRHVYTWRAEPGRTEYVEINGVLVPVYVNPLSEDETYAGQNWPGEPAHQTFQFIREGDINGTLYVAGALGRYAASVDRLDLYRVDCDGGLNCERAPIRLKWISSNDKSTYPNADAFTDKTASLAAASSYYVSPSGELLFYATEHDNDLEGAVKAGEWRHVNMVRPGSPTLLPGIALDGPFTVPEGGSVALTGFGAPPITKAWIELYADPMHRGRSAVIDYDDWYLDDFDNFHAFEEMTVQGLTLGESFSDKASAWRWFAPAGCTIRANDHHFGYAGFPGESTLELPGTSVTEAAPDLRTVSNQYGTGGMNDDITSAEFLDDCLGYYERLISLDWDLDGNGSYETSGMSVTFSAALLDGPTEVEVPARARHPIDERAAQAVAAVKVANVAPTPAELQLQDVLNHSVGSEVPFVVLGLPVTLRTTFTDPGRPDHQTASIAWGDGHDDPNGVFRSFRDAFGGANGVIEHAHRYRDAGSYRVAVSIRDDDGGTASRGDALRVVTPINAMREIIGMIDEAIASATPVARQRLEKARQALAGNARGSGAGGALDLLETGRIKAAMARMVQAIGHLRVAQAVGASVATPINSLEQVIAAVRH